MVLLRLADSADVDAAKSKAGRKRGPQRKWICGRGGRKRPRSTASATLVCVIMDDENADYYLENFAPIRRSRK